MYLIKKFQKTDSKAFVCFLNEQFEDNGWKKENEDKLRKRVLSCLQAMNDYF
ncbi:hypothetical protein NCS13_1_0369 [Neochlamydia sp. S13]|nr:hypothetical protein NCS13_1_0369 [Neochlamydia sp. S13]